MIPWENVGGQLIRKDHMDTLRHDILTGKIDSWDGVHQAYREFATHYEEEKAVLGIQVLRMLAGHAHLTEKDWAKCLQHLADVRSYIEMQVYLTKEKDYQNPFRMVTYENEAERDAVLGKVDDNPFILQSKKTTQSLLALTKRVSF